VGAETVFVREDQIDDAFDRAVEALRDRERWIERIDLFREKAREFAPQAGWVCVGSVTATGDGGQRSWWVMINLFTGAGRCRPKR
jgi:hypothetical protein